MTAAEWCVFAALMLYLLTIAPIKWIGFRRFDNARPRDPGFYQDPIAARARSAHTRTASRRFRSSRSRCCWPSFAAVRSGWSMNWRCCS